MRDSSLEKVLSMNHNRIVTENQLDEWVRGNSRAAQGVIVALVWRLVSAASPKPKKRRFPLGDSIEQAGPEGRSFWEIGTGVQAGTKATSDYRDLTRATPNNVRQQSTFIFVTPLSGKRDWPYTWKPTSQATWLTKRREDASRSNNG